MDYSDISRLVTLWGRMSSRTGPRTQHPGSSPRRRRSRRGLRLALATALIFGLMPVAAAGAQSPDHSHEEHHSSKATPALIKAARRRGEVSRFRADLLLAYALGAPGRIPERFRSNEPWDGTLVLLELRTRVERMDAGPQRTQLKDALESRAATSCSSKSSPTNRTNTAHYLIDYVSTIGGGLSIEDYKTSLETAWAKQLDTFGWASPPLHPSAGGKYHVIVDDLGTGLYGFVSPTGTYAGFVGNNPATSWDDVDAFASCMVLNSDYSPFLSSTQASLDATTAHELNHSIQFGYGALAGVNRPDDSFIEGGATWMEDEVFDDANDNYFYLWPQFHESMGQYPTDSPYEYWLTFRGLTEPYGTGTGGAGEQVMQDFWEGISKGSPGALAALNTALANRGTTLADAYHAYAIATRFTKACAGSYLLPHCLEESPGYLATVGLPPYASSGGAIASRGGSFSGSIPDNYALNWVTLPTGASKYVVRLSNTSTGGRLRATVVCDNGTNLRRTPLPAVVGPASSTKVEIDPAGCLSVAAVITNQLQTAPEPTSSTSRSYTLGTLVPTRTVNVQVSGSGVVTSAPAGINCGTDCSETFASSTTVTLTADPGPSSAFTGWAGDCTGTDACVLSPDGNAQVTATFTDASPPSTPVLGSLTRFRTQKPLTLTWGSATDPESGIDGYSLEKRVAPHKKSFGPWQPAGTFTTTVAEQTLEPGYSYCFRVSATNGAGTSSAPSNRTCTALPLDDRALSPSGPWKFAQADGFYLNTHTVSSTRGATLKERVKARRLVLVARVCPTCGKVKVSMGKTLLRKISLKRATIGKKRVIPITKFDELRSGTVAITIISSGKPVSIDGLGAGRF